MIARLARFANDCFHVVRAPAGSKVAILKSLLLPGTTRMGFGIAHFDRPTLNHLYREIFARQQYYFRAECETPLILDCGANIGVASLYFKWLYPRSRVLAFEPDPATFQLLTQNIVQNNLDIEAHNCALWDHDGDIDFFVDSRNPGTLVMSTNASRLTGKPLRVPARRLSSFIDGTVSMLKLDVEGAEHHVLRDLGQTGKMDAIRQMVIEYHHRIGADRSCLAGFLLMLETAGFEYQIHAAVHPVNSRVTNQDIIIGAYR